MPKTPAPWRLRGFLEALDVWEAAESPTDDLRLIVTAWVLSRYEDPYQGVRREKGFQNLWVGRVPRSQDGTGGIVACSYWIIEDTRTALCDSFVTFRPKR